MILNIFNDLVVIYNENIKDSFMNAISLDFVFIFIIVIFALILLLVFIVLILPLFKPSPAKLYRKYLYFRDEMKRVDALYSQKKIIFEEYVSQQFINAQEYYRVVKILSSDPNYKTKLQSYTLQDNQDKSKSVVSSTRKLTTEEMRLKQINKLCEVLKPKAAFYSKEDIYSVLLYEGFEEGLIREVLKQLINQNVVFSKQSSSNRQDLSLFLNDLIKGKGAANFKNINTSESISFEKKETNSFFKDDFKRKELNFDKIDDVDYTFKTEPVIIKEERPGFFKRLFGIGKKKEVVKPKPSINEIDGILKNIEQEIKTKEV